MQQIIEGPNGYFYDIEKDRWCKTMAQQTAVDWLREQYVHITWMVNRDELPTDTVFEFMLNRFEQAKQIEREQIVKAHGLKYFDLTEEVITGDQYYTKTYGK